ncbi:MAG TPA: hypothetical protein PKG60_03610 [Spirochaetota bacterium]|nr:hypothetical protein [Spirochaetota bacterium]HPS85491.1 hypothetical protein [Spirochaetota bacterium]
MDALKELLYSLGSFCARMIKTSIDWFMDLSLLNKIIVINTLTSFLAITLPIAKYYIFESWTGINNPVAVYLILIVAIMFGTIFFHGPLVLGARVIINIWYLISVIAIYATHSISHAPYVLSAGFFFNLIAPVIYIAAAVMVYLEGDN